MDEAHCISPFQRVVSAAAGLAGGQGRALQVFALDNACAHIARVAKEPIMAQIRLAWWRDGLSAEALTAQHDAPDMVALRAVEDFTHVRSHLVAMIDGWEELILGGEGSDRDMLVAYARGRGAGLFAAVAPSHSGQSAVAGQVWALWDLAGHLSDTASTEKAVALANDLVKDASIAGLPRVLKMMAGPAIADIKRGRGAPPMLTPGLYARMMRFQIFG